MSKGLGRGFGALLPGEDSFSVPDAATGDTVKIVPLTSVEPNPDQPRKEFDQAALEELAASIKEQGVLQPLLVEGWASGYRIVAGERRWRAAFCRGLQREWPAGGGSAQWGGAGRPVSGRGV